MFIELLANEPPPLEVQRVDCRPPSLSIWCEEMEGHPEVVAVFEEEEVQYEL